MGEAIATVQEQIYGNNQLKMQLKSAQDAEDKERRRIMKQEQDKIDAMRKEMEREKMAMELERQKKKKEEEERRRRMKQEAEELEHKKKAMRLEKQRKERAAKAERDRQKAEQERLARQKAKEEEARRKELEKRRKLKELEEEKEAEMERQKKKKNHEWDINCKGNGMKVNEQIVNGSNAYETIWLKGIVAEGTNEWKFKIIDAGNVYIGITNEKNEKKKDSYLDTLFYWPYWGFLYDADGKRIETNGKAKKNDIVVMILDLNQNKLKFMKNGKQIGPAMTVKNGSYRAAVSMFASSDSIELLSN